jgi:hypothetical protein
VRRGFFGLERLRPRLNHATVVAYLALFVALGGGAYAAISGIPDSSGVFHACVNRSSGALRVVKPGVACKPSKKKNGRVVFAGEFATAWNQRGPAGLNGTNGTNGINGTNGAPGTARAYGVFRSNGVLANAKNASLGASHTPGSGMFCIALAAGIDPATAVLVATPDFDGDATTLGSNATQTVVEWDSGGGNCPNGQLAVRTGFRSQSGAAPVNSVDITAADEAFSFVIP